MHACVSYWFATQGQNAHMGSAHINIKHTIFDNADSFLQWKNAEGNTQTSFVQQCGSKQRNGKEYTYYYCNRHGNYHPKGSGKRAMKSQGTCKLGEPCTAYMKAITCASSGSVH